LDTESGGSSPFPPLDTESGGSSPFPPLNTESGGSSPFSPVENQMGLLHFLLLRIRWVFSISSCYRSDGSSPFPHVGYIWWVFSVSSCYIGGMWVECILPREGVLPSNRVRNGFDSWPFGYVVECHSKLSNGFDSWPVGYVATASILGQSAMSETVTVYSFSFVRALNPLHLEFLNSLLIKAFIV
uniref:MATH domain-containing protein n=1 Tax=Rodentolepis nana TaxID=102285 RepID=A0A0R3TF72_RODNA